MDGTLVDSMPYWRSLCGDYLAAKGITGVPEDLEGRIKAMTIRESAVLLLRLFGLPGTPDTISAEINGLMERNYRETVPLKPGVRAYLDVLRGRGVRMCVASATAAPLMELCLTRLGVREYFSFLLSCEEVGAGKDRPDVYLAATRRLGAAPADTAVFEDAFHAAHTAQAAGFHVVGVRDSDGDDWARLARTADEIIPDWARAAEKELARDRRNPLPAGEKAAD